MFRFCLHSLFVTSCLVSLLAALPARSADPPARSQGSPVTVMDNQGRVLKTLQEPPTKEALAAKAAEEERQRDKAKADAEQARKDRILLDSYTTEAEIDLARNRASQALEQQMEIARSYTASLAKRQAELQKRKGELGAKGLPPAEEQELGRLQAEVAALAGDQRKAAPGPSCRDKHNAHEITQQQTRCPRGATLHQRGLEKSARCNAGSPAAMVRSTRSSSRGRDTRAADRGGEL